MAFHPCRQFLNLNRLCDKIHRPALESLDFIKLAIERGKKYNRDVPRLSVGLELSTDSIAVDVGHHDVE